jgi:EF-P beta-lysylation protein EpmB
MNPPDHAALPLPAGHSGRMPAWQRELAQAITDPAELLDALGLDRDLLPAARAATRRFGLKVPRPYLANMRRGDPHDPLLRQVLPLADEVRDVAGFVGDPVGDGAATVAPGVLSKYRGRSLLMTTGACAVNCRYCFRREYPYTDGIVTPTRLDEAIAALAADPDCEEVILSGGDPLALSTSRLEVIAQRLEALPRLRRLRIHSRTPVVLPERVDTELLAWLDSLRWPVVLVLHANHPRELSNAVGEACTKLRQSGVTLLNQAVLLAGVNDAVATQCELATRLFELGVLPYYLHALDPVRGAAHFEVEATRAGALYEAMRARLPGYLLPRFVREVEGAPAKLPVP